MAGVLALPAVTQESGFLASAAALAGGSAYSVAIGLLLAELYVNSTAAARQGTPDGGGGVEDSGGGGQGSGGGVEEGSSGSAVFAEIARSTLGERGVALGAGAYLFLHVALLVAYISKSAEVVSAATGLGTLPSAALFVAAFGGLCYCSSSALLDRVNGLLVVLILGSFFGLLASAAPLVEPAQLLRADWGAVPATLPVIALAFV
ncbi:tyrosine-specific transport protein [Monoraphidium neglectum]|uniref:Tyrosine-specific transport protein n=1 Tax=Monoraphidium neglectum TaxID=145388 RepID=A0A0D2L9R4_9CHLO|nr:tyrosine-specific transport protein [Monoraphidium neglectum]KIZ03539.1 tyrosine-specific transport protein [Monoraphidium neglectum]|eukprot:XP_013902558.1 tyrosine-specific transport protein [Monoraphidium neglectum]